MELSPKDKLILYNQYELLKHLDPDNLHDYAVKQRILSDGYQHEHYLLWDMLNDEELSDEDAGFVWDVLDMYRALWISYQTLPEGQKKEIDSHKVVFDGFDGNMEGVYYSYTSFILQDMGRYEEISHSMTHGINSHFPRLDFYKRQLKTWKALTVNKHRNLSLETIKEIVSA